MARLGTSATERIPFRSRTASQFAMKNGSAQESDKTPGFIGFLVGATSQSANRLIGWECAESLSGRALKWDLHAGQMAKQQSGPRLGEQWVRHVAAG